MGISQRPGVVTLWSGTTSLRLWNSITIAQCKGDPDGTNTAEHPCHEGELRATAWTPRKGVFQPPQDLVFVPRGNASFTRRLTPDAAYEVMEKPQRSGFSQRRSLLVRPEDLQAARHALAETEAQRVRQRQGARRRRQSAEAAYREAFRAEVLRQFPRAPAGAVAEIVSCATRVGSGQVGRSRKISLEKRASGWPRPTSGTADPATKAGWLPVRKGKKHET